jgi:hypothetical protein
MKGNVFPVRPQMLYLFSTGWQAMANAPDQKRAGHSDCKPTSAPVFCIWMLYGLDVIQYLINRKNPACHKLRSRSINLVYFINDELTFTRII